MHIDITRNRPRVPLQSSAYPPLPNRLTVIGAWSIGSPNRVATSMLVALAPSLDDPMRIVAISPMRTNREPVTFMSAFYFHRLDDHKRVPRLDNLPDLAQELPDRTGHFAFHLATCQRRSPRLVAISMTSPTRPVCTCPSRKAAESRIRTSAGMLCLTPSMANASRAARRPAIAWARDGHARSSCQAVGRSAA